jgi:predicted metal-dependent HD superfamily phosphohydrolase
MTDNRAAVRTLLPLWRGHVNALGCFDAQLSQRLFDALCADYSQPHRAYHTLEHLVQIFEKLEQHAETTRDPLRLAFAAWYHDAVYDPRGADNEERSAARAEAELKRMTADPQLPNRVAQLILATKSHHKGADDADGDLFLDIDYSILGAGPDAYKIYAAQIRGEYAHLSDDRWRVGRAAFLKTACERTPTFRTGLFEGAYGAQARANMAAELTALAP